MGEITRAVNRNAATIDNVLTIDRHQKLGASNHVYGKRWRPIGQDTLFILEEKKSVSLKEAFKHPKDALNRVSYIIESALTKILQKLRIDTVVGGNKKNDEKLAAFERKVTTAFDKLPAKYKDLVPFGQRVSGLDANLPNELAATRTELTTVRSQLTAARAEQQTQAAAAAGLQERVHKLNSRISRHDHRHTAEKQKLERKIELLEQNVATKDKKIADLSSGLLSKLNPFSGNHGSGNANGDPKDKKKKSKGAQAT